MLNKISHYFLKVYDKNHYLIQQKSRFLLVICLISLLFFPAMMITSIDNGSLDFEVFLPLFLGLLYMIVALYTLKKGYYTFTAHSALIVFFASAWAMLIFDPTSEPIAKLDTIGFIYAILAITPLLTIRKKIVIVVYFIANIIIFIATSLYLFSVLNIPEYSQQDYLGDNLGAFFILGVACYFIFHINTNAQAINRELIKEQNEKTLEITKILETVDIVSKRLSNSVEAMGKDITVFSDSSQTQAASIEEVTSTMEEVTGNTENISAISNMQDEALNDVISELRKLNSIVDESGKELQKIISVRNTLNSETETTRENLDEIVTYVDGMSHEFKKIEGIMGLINDISDQINLLSLNAAIEAARAGEFGRGFAVVADEISKLADQTANNVKSINTLINNNVAGLNKSNEKLKSFVMVMERMIEYILQLSSSIDKINALSAEDTKINDEIKIKTTSVIELAGTMKDAMEEQKIANDEILKSLSTINISTQNVSERAAGLNDTSDEVDLITLELKEVLKNKS